MVLPSLKSIKTLFGSPNRRTSHSSRKHKEKKLARTCELVTNCDPVAPDLHSYVSENRDVELKDYRAFEQEITVSTSNPDPRPILTTTPNTLLTLEDVGAVCPTVEVVGCQTNTVKESPAKARVAPFNSANDENWSESDQNVVDFTEEKDENQTNDSKDELSIIKELLGRKVTERQILAGDEEKTVCTQDRADSVLSCCLNGDDGVGEALNRERVLRLQAEKRLHDVSCENERSKESLSKLQCDFLRLEEMLCSLLQYKTKIDWLKREKASQSLTYEVKLRKYQNFVANLQKENMLLLSEVKSLEASSKQTDDRERNLSRVLLERLRYLETENSSLVLETEQQRLQYERCLDDVANQVVQALLTQKSLREECIKLQKRVSDLEQRNRTLNLLFQQHVHMAPDSGFYRRFAGKLSSYSGTQQGSNRSSIATQTMSQSEDSLESLASLCSEYSTQSSISGECTSGNMVIGIPGLPQLSSPPLWIRNCLEQTPWNSSYLGSNSASASAVPGYFGACAARGGADGEQDKIRPSSLLDDYVWPGMQSWDIDELVDGEDNMCNYVMEGKSSTIQKRPLVVGVLPNNLTSPSAVPVLLQMSPMIGLSKDPGVFGDSNEAAGSSAMNSNLVMSEGEGCGKSSKVLWPSHKMSLTSVKRPRGTAIVKTRQMRKSHCRSPKSLSLANRKFRNGLDGKCRSSLPRQFQFRSDEPDATICIAEQPTERKAENSQKSTGEEERKKDEGYSTMSSDVQSQQEVVPVEKTIDGAKLLEEEDESEKGYWMDMDRLSLLVIAERETKREAQPDVLVEETVKLEAETVKLEAESSICEENIDDANLEEPIAEFSTFSNGSMIANVEEFPIPFNDNEQITGKMSRSVSAPEIYRFTSNDPVWRPRSASSACTALNFECYLWWCASEGSLTVDGSTDGNAVTILRRSKGKVCLTVGQSGGNSVEGIAGDVGKSQEKSVMVHGEIWCNEDKDFPISPEEIVEDDCGKADGQMVLMVDKGDSGTDSCEISTSSICSSSTVVRFSILEEPVLELFEDTEANENGSGREVDEDGNAEVEVEEQEKEISTPVVDFCGEFYRLCNVDADSCGMDWAGIMNEASALAAVIKNSEEDEEDDDDREEELVGSDDSSVEDRDEDRKTDDVAQLLPLQDSASVREKLEELSAMMAESGGTGDDFHFEEIPANRNERSGKEGCTTSWIHVEADIDLTDPRARANLLDTMLGSSASSSSSNSECGDEPSDYQHLHQLHRHRRHCKATERENCILRYIHPPRPSIIGRRDFFFRYGEQEKAAVASFDFLEDMSTSVSDFGSAETLHAEEREDKDTAMKNSSCYGSSVTLQSQGVVNACSVDRLSLSDSCAESFSSSNQSLNLIDN